MLNSKSMLCLKSKLNPMLCLKKSKLNTMEWNRLLLLTPCDIMNKLLL